MFMQFICVFFAALAVWALFYDYILRNGDAVLLTGEAWYALSPGGINLVQAVIQRYVHPSLWDELFLPILQAPFWIFCAALAGLFALFWGVSARRRKYY